MPKLVPDYPVRVDVSVSKKMRMEIVAIAYHMGAKGKYAKAARHLLRMGIDKYLEKLSPKEKGNYERIYSNVMLMEGETLP